MGGNLVWAWVGGFGMIMCISDCLGVFLLC